MQFADDAPDALGGLEHGRRVHQRLALARRLVLDALLEQAHDRLTDGEISGRGYCHDALARLPKYMQLAKGRYVVETRIGTSIGDHDEPLAHKDSATIGHGHPSD